VKPDGLWRKRLFFPQNFLGNDAIPAVVPDVVSLLQK
jgi:hypothetical protein